MAHHHEPHLKEGDKRRLGAGARSFGLTAIVVGVVALAAAVLASKTMGGGWRQFGFAYVLNYAFFLSITLGGLFIVLVTHLFRAGWVVAVRRIAEVMAANAPTMAVLFIPILMYVYMGGGTLYPWADGKYGHPDTGAHHGMVEPGDMPGVRVLTVSDEASAHEGPADGAGVEAEAEAEAGAGQDGYVARQEALLAGQTDALVPGKRPYLTKGFFTLRWVVYILIWSGLGLWYLRTSTNQEGVATAEGKASLTRKMEVLAAPGTLLFALTLTFAAFDLLMSLDPVWFSTMWGVYYFAGCALSAVATLTLSLMVLQRSGYLPSVNVEHYHDLGKLLFTFVFFWGYIAFSQYMLIWYGNLAEESYWFELRGVTTQAGNPFISGWTWVALALLLGHLLIPFMGLLSRHIKRSRKLLAFWAVWMLVMHWVDLWWVVMPNYSTPNPRLPVIELLCLAGIGGIAVGATVLRAAGQGLIAAGDPRLGDSLGHENMY